MKPVTTVLANSPCSEAIETMREKGFDQLPVLAPRRRKLVGLVTLGNLLSWISHGRASAHSPVSDVMFNFSKISEAIREPRDVGDLQPPSGNSKPVRNGGAHSKRTPQKRKFFEITLETPLRALNRFFESNSAAVVTEIDVHGDMKPIAVVTKLDLLAWLVRQGSIST